MLDLVLDARMIGHSGIGTYIRCLLPYFKESKLNFKLIGNPKSLEKYPSLKDYPWLFCSAPIYSIAEQLHLPFLVPSTKLFWSPHYNVPLLPLRAKKRLVTIHDCYHLTYLSTFNFLERLYAKKVMARAVCKATQIIVESQFTKGELLRHFPDLQTPIKLIPLGSGDQELQESKPILKLPIPKEFLLFVGNVKPHKNLEGLIKALEILQNKGHTYSLVIAGKIEGLKHGISKEKILKLSPMCSFIHFLGEVDQPTLSYLYTKATAFVFPSLYEGWGFPPLEAMRLGCPVLGSNAASLLESCGEGAYYFDPHDLEKMAEAIHTVWEDQSVREALIAKGKKRVAELSWVKTAHRHLELIEKMISEELI